jgi:hypothetical protein
MEGDDEVEVLRHARLERAGDARDALGFGMRTCLPVARSLYLVGSG